MLYASAPNVLSKLAGNTTSGIQYLSQTGTGAVSAAPVWSSISGGDITGAALTKVDDVNVTLTLGGSPSTALLRATSLTLGWSGQLGLTRGGTAASLIADNGGIVYSGASSLAILASTVTARQMLQSGSSAAPTWSTTVWPASSAQGDLLYSSAANTISGLAKDTNATRYLSNTGASNNPAWAQIALTTGVTGILPSANGGTGVNNGSSTITLGGSLTTSGAFASTFTMTGATNVTFPTSGTLSTTTGTVTSIGISSTTGLQVTSSPVTTSGTIAVNFPNAVTGRNLVFNGGFNIWQRGTSFTPGAAAPVYTADRWYCGSVTASSSFSRVANSATGSYSMRMQRIAASSSPSVIFAATSLSNDMCANLRNGIFTIKLHTTSWPPILVRVREM